MATAMGKRNHPGCSANNLPRAGELGADHAISSDDSSSEGFQRFFQSVPVSGAENRLRIPEQNQGRGKNFPDLGWGFPVENEVKLQLL